MDENNSVNQLVNNPIEQPKQNNFLITLLSILLLISVFIAGFFAYQTQRLVAELRIKNEELMRFSSAIVKTTTPTPTHIQSPEPSETPIDTGSGIPIPSPVACTMEAKICPDGSAVGRVGPKCEFSPCPTPKN
jgi:hypothetical protein